VTERIEEGRKKSANERSNLFSDLCCKRKTTVRARVIKLRRGGDRDKRESTTRCSRHVRCMRILFPTRKRGLQRRVNVSQFAQPTLCAIVKINWYMQNRQIPTVHRDILFPMLHDAICEQRSCIYRIFTNIRRDTKAEFSQSYLYISKYQHIETKIREFTFIIFSVSVIVTKITKYSRAIRIAKDYFITI